MDVLEHLKSLETLETLETPKTLESSQYNNKEQKKQDDLIATIERDFAEVAAVVTDMMHKGEALIKHFNDNKQILAGLIVKRYDEFIKSSEERKRELLSQLEERELSSETALQLDIEQCQTYLAWIQSQCVVIDTIKNNKDKEVTSKALYVLNNLSVIRSAALNLFQISEIRVNIDCNLDKMIKECGKIVQLSISLTEYSAIFDTDHYEIKLVTKTTDGELYPYGGLSTTAHIGDSISYCSIDNNDGTYFIKIPYDMSFVDLPITIKINDRVVAQLTELYIMTDRVDHTDSMPYNTTHKITDGIDKLYVRYNSHLELANIYQGRLHMIFSKKYHDIYAISRCMNTWLSVRHGHIVIASGCSYENLTINLHKLNTELIRSYSIDMQYIELVQAIFNKSDLSENIVFVTILSKTLNRINILDCKTGDVTIHISIEETGASRVKIALGNGFIYVIIKNIDSSEDTLKLFDYLGKLVISYSFNEKLNSIWVEDDYVILATNKFIIIGNKDLTIIRCRVPIDYNYEIIRYEDGYIYAISNIERIMSSWRVYGLPVK